MIKKLKIKFLLTIMFFVTVIIASLVAVISVVPVQRGREEARTFLERIAEVPTDAPNTPSFQIEPKPMQRPELDFGKENNMFSISNLVTAQLDKSGNLLSWFSDRQDLYDEEYIKAAADRILNDGKDFGTLDGQYYLLTESPGGYYLALLDNSVAFENSRNTLVLALISGAGAWVLLFILAVFLVNKMTKPVAMAFEKQKRFVSDAGHELKTPLAVISANANVLESEIGENKWISYIQTETGRMDSLVKNLMELASIEDDSKASKHSDFDLSKAVLSAGLPFESLAFEKGTVIQFEVQPDVIYQGSEEQIKQLVTILLSNAVKYGNERGIIRVSLSAERKKISLNVYNTGQGIENEEKNKIFDRFYRVDKARSRQSGSYGLGLAIAKAVVEEHNGKISVDSEYGKWVCFNVQL